MITLHHLDTLGAYRTVWLLEELQLLYQIASHAETAQSPLSACKHITLVDGDNAIVGNYAIADYLLNKYDRRGLRPPVTSTAFLQYQQWIGIIETALLPLLHQFTSAEKLANSRVPFFARSILKKTVQNSLSNPTLDNILTLLQRAENSLDKNGWICDVYFSAADIQLTYALDIASQRGIIDAQQYPNCMAFLNTVQVRQTYQNAQEKLASIPVDTVSVFEGNDEAESSSEHHD